MSMWPNLYIAGAPKCGTSSLHVYLQGVPGIFMSRIKEPNFFARIAIPDDHPIMPIRDEGRYLQLFAAAGDARYRGESSPSYLEDPEAPYLIDRAAPDAKVIVSLRDPVERLHSHYLMLLNNRPALGGFLEEAKRGLTLQHDRSLSLLWPETGRYHDSVRRYMDVFGADRFKVLIFEELSADAPGTLRQVLDFLGIEHPVNDDAPPKHRGHGQARGPLVRYLFGNKAIARAAEKWIPAELRKLIREKFLVKQVPKPEIEPEAREFLLEYYADDVRRLAELLGRPLPWRNFQDFR